MKKYDANESMLKWMNGIGNMELGKQEEIKEEPIIINMPSVDTWNITALRYTCRKNKVKGYTKMDREQLIIEVRKIIHEFKEEK